MVSSISPAEDQSFNVGDCDSTETVFPLGNEKVLIDFCKKYDVQHILGTGASGVVRKCVEKETGRQFAVKIIDLIGVEDEMEKACLQESTLQEISILKLVSPHPHIVELHDTFVGSTYVLLVFELCKQELFDILIEVVTLSEGRTRQIMKQLLTAVEFLHSRYIVHRDIKAENILLDEYNNIKLSDFGFASTLQHDEQFTDLCGTFEYLSPEIMKNQLNCTHPGYGRSVDMCKWACGVLMYTMMYGVSPFWAPDRTSVFKNIVRGTFSFKDQRLNDFSTVSKDLISRLLVIDPKKRLTASEALRHTFFRDRNVPDMTSSSNLKNKHSKLSKEARMRLKFKAVVRVVQATIFFQKLIPQTIISLYEVSSDPYLLRPFRRIIDFGAFKIYGHWVTRDPTQSRELLFENTKKKVRNAKEAR